MKSLRISCQLFLYHTIQSVEGEVRELKEQVQGVEGKVRELKGQVQGVQSEVLELKEQVQGIEGKARELEGHVQGIRLTLENETNKNINIVAEGHLDPFCMITTALGKLYCVNH